MFLFDLWGVIFKKPVKTAVPDAGNPPGALVSTKLIEWCRFGVGDDKYNALHFVVYAFWGQFWCSKLGPQIGSSASPSLGIISPIEVAPYAGALARYGLSGRGRLNKTFSRRARRSRGARSVVRVVSNSWY